MTLVIIPARGGSKGLPRKNLAKLGNVSLIRIASMQAEVIFDGLDANILISSEDDEILKEAGKYGVHRPAELATDIASTIDVIRYHMGKSSSEYGCLMQPTHSFRDLDSLRRDVKSFIGSDYDSLMQVRENMSFFWTEDKTCLNGPRKRRQDRKPYYEETGVFYMFKRSATSHTDWVHGKIMYSITSQIIIDIDTERDLELARKMDR